MLALRLKIGSHSEFKIKINKINSNIAIRRQVLYKFPEKETLYALQKFDRFLLYK